MTKGIEVCNVVQDFSIGNTQVKICDDYCCSRTPREIEEILERIAQHALEEFSAVTVVTTPCTD